MWLCRSNQISDGCRCIYYQRVDRFHWLTFLYTIFCVFFFLSNAWHRLQRSAAPHQGADSRSSNNTHRVDWNLWLRMENMAPLANKMELGWFNCFEICSHCRQGIRGRSVMWTLLEIERIDLIDWEIGKWPRWLRTVRQVARCLCVCEGEKVFLGDARIAWRH